LSLVNKDLEFCPQLLVRLGMFRVDEDAFDRTDLDALRRIVVTDALGAAPGFYFVDARAQGYRAIRADRRADVAIDACLGDLQCHRKQQPQVRSARIDENAPDLLPNASRKTTSGRHLRHREQPGLRDHANEYRELKSHLMNAGTKTGIAILRRPFAQPDQAQDTRQHARRFRRDSWRVLRLRRLR
jgi:hypothetical protein